MTQDSKRLSLQGRLLLVTILVALAVGLLCLPAAPGQSPNGDFLTRLLLWQGLIWGGYALARCLVGRLARRWRFPLGLEP